MWVCQCADDVNKHGDVQVKRLGTTKLRNETKNEETKRNETKYHKAKRNMSNKA